MMMIAPCFVAGCATAHKKSHDVGTIRIVGGDAALTEVIAPVVEIFEEENPSLRLVAEQSKPGTELAALEAAPLLSACSPSSHK
uniref:ABC-type phosphate transport system periplasmic component-like protein n=1 Tax=Geobacter sp. (strain M21) TaxID=443144 RepID=C6E1D3_GEOSM